MTEENWDNFVELQYEEYLLQHCTCDRSEDCSAISLQSFEHRLLRELDEERGEAAYWDLQLCTL